jgi:hypothetical protein
MPATVAISTAGGSATLVYQVDRTNGIVPPTPIAIISRRSTLQLRCHRS